jgi:ribonuclease BN (tRNA processing enzyme)
VKLTVFGGCGAWPAAGQACSGYLAEHEGFRLLIDPGYAVVPRLLEHLAATEVDAVLVSHGHPDHCADVHPLLRARAFGGDPPGPLPIHAPPGAVDRVVTLSGPDSLRDSYTVHSFEPGEEFAIGPFGVRSVALPHSVLNAGVRLAAGGKVLSYTGDTGPTPDLVGLARGADLFLAEATYPEQVPGENAAYLSSARQAGEYAAAAGAGRLLLTHLWPGTDPAAAEAAARRSYGGPLAVARMGLVADLDGA